MKIYLYRDETVNLRLDEIVASVSRLMPDFVVATGAVRFTFADEIVTNPGTYLSLDYRINEECGPHGAALLFTDKPYDNNYFWDSYDVKRAIISFFGWEFLTDLPRENGAVLFLCALMVRWLRVGRSHRDRNTGCINDFWGDKRGVHRGMRTAYVCESCISTSKAMAVPPQLKGIQAVLDDLSAASRAGENVCDFWASKADHERFQLFMCHNSEDKPSVRVVNRQLQSRGILTWLDEEQIPPGRPWQDLLERQIEEIAAAAVFVGTSGYGPWQSLEVKSFIQEFVRRQCPVIPVILSECPTIPELPVFLRQFMWVDFRKSQPDPIDMLLWGITGRRPS